MIRRPNGSTEVAVLGAVAQPLNGPVDPIAQATRERALPDDLVPIPSGSWPSNAPLDAKVVRTALWLEHGNLHKAADRIGCARSRFASFVNSSQFLKSEHAAARMLILDRAEGVIYDSLNHEDIDRREDAARFVLNTLGSAHGWGSKGGGSVSLASPNGGKVVFRWGDEVDAEGNDVEA